MAQLLLVRHCESIDQSPKSPLTDAGVLAAAQLADRLERFAPDAIYSSPYVRAVMTIQPFADRASIKPIEDHRLSERTLAASPLSDWLDHIRLSYDDLDHRAPGGESLRETQSRGVAALSDIASQGHRLPLVASHGGMISSILVAIDPAFGFEQWRLLRNPDLFELDFESAKPVAYRRIDLPTR